MMLSLWVVSETPLGTGKIVNLPTLGNLTIPQLRAVVHYRMEMGGMQLGAEVRLVEGENPCLQRRWGLCTIKL